MTGDVMVDMLGLRLEDPEESSFSSDAKIKALNLSQKTVVNLIHNAYLTELEVEDANETVASGKVAFSGLTSAPVRNGIVSVKIYGGNYATMIDVRDVARTQNSLLSGTATNPIAYVFDENIYILPTGTTALDVRYLAEPADIADSSGSESSLNEALHEIILDFAESQLWRMDAQSERAASAYTSGSNLVNALNARYEAEAPSGVGTKGRR
jgi:hypothetical protein